MVHVFVVNEKTFKIHLEYMFAGTGYSDNEPGFIIDNNVSNKSDYKEKTFVSMIADVSKVRKNDLVLFYVTGCKKIFGVFQVDSLAFLNPKSKDYLGEEESLGRYLPFRVKIKPFMVFSEGVTEHEALDDIRCIEHPYEMCWSLIYRKLTGMRGCSYITDFEYRNIFSLLTANNIDGCLHFDNYTYDKENKRIVGSKESHLYMGKTYSLDITQRLLRVSNSFEAHLQAYLTQNHDKEPLRSLLYPKDHIRKVWLGNEVVCSVGEQRMDLLSIVETSDRYLVRIIELKYDTPGKEIVNEQIRWYLRWVGQYLVPLMNDKKVVIIPTVIAARYNRNSKKKREFFEACTQFNQSRVGSLYGFSLSSVEYISFDRKDIGITFEKVF